MPVQKICPTCKRAFQCKPSHVDKKTYCSKDCMAISYRSALKGSANPNFKNAGTRTCEECNSPYRSYNKARRYCSQECARKANAESLQSFNIAKRKVLRCKDCSAKLHSHRTYCAKCWQRRNPGIYNQTCETCGKRIPIKHKRRWCSTECRPKVPPPTSTCSKCGNTVLGYKRKYCDRCWEGRMARSRKVDDNQPEIVQALRAVGCGVLDLSAVGKGCPDLVVSYQNMIYLVEIKSAKGKLNLLQQKWHSEWRGRPPVIVRTIQEAFDAVGVKTA